MPGALPREYRLPAGYRRGSASYLQLPAGSVLWRVHESEYQAESFAPPREDPYYEGNRFDGTPQDPFYYHYSADQARTALAEVVLRTHSFNSKTVTRLIPFYSVQGRMLSAVETTADFRLISLFSAEDLARVGQDEWLLEAEDAELIRTRQWVRQLREVEDDVQGLMWMSRRNRPNPCYLLFHDRCGDDPLKPADPSAFDFTERADLNAVNEILKPLGAAIDIPPWLV